MRDITEHKRVEAELKKHREHLEELVEERTAELKRTNETLETEITGRKQAEEALRASQQIIEGIIDAIPVRVFWKDRNLVYLGCNAALARDAGFAHPKDIIGKNDYQMGWRDQAELYRCDDRQVIESGCPKLLIEEPMTTPEGNIITLLTSKVPLRNSEGEISGILGTYMDISERKQVEKALAHKTMLLEAHLQTSISGILAVDNLGHAVFFNKRFGELWRMPQQILDEKNEAKMLEYALTQLKDPAEFSCKIAYLREHKDEKCSDEIEFTDGRCFNRYSSPLLGARGTYYGRIWYFYDISECKQANEKLKLTLADLERSNNELEQFAYVASHDLQEPLRMVSSYTQLLARRYQGKLGADADEFIAFAVDGANRMQGLINDLLAYSRVGARVKGFEPTDCSAVLDQALADLKAAIEKSGAVVTYDPLPAVMADNSQLVQLFQNLIGNAIKFHVEDRPVFMSRLSKREMNGSFPSAITASASSPNMPSASSLSSSACTLKKSTPAQASAWPSARRSWSVAAGAFGWSRNPGQAPHFTSQSP